MPRHSAHRACDDFRRTTEAVRSGLLESGLTRRQVIGRGLTAGLAVYAAKAMPLTRIFETAEASAAAAPDAPILVSVFLPGGTDLLDTIVPRGGDYGRYADLHRDFKVEPVELAGTDYGLHPAMAAGVGGGVKGLFEQGKLGFLPGIDYANPNLSHFHSRHFWETGLITQKTGTGWLGRWLDRHGSNDNPLQGVSMEFRLSPVMRSASAPVAAITSPGSSQFWIPNVWGKAFDDAMATWAEMASRPAWRPGEQAATRAARMTKEVADRLAPYAGDKEGGPFNPPVEYPKTDFGERLSDLAGLLSLPLGIRTATVSAQSDFDTHDKQGDDLRKGLTEVSEGLAAFQADLEARGLADRVLTFVWSEFGRRPEGNESGGTDHGAGGLSWVQGMRAKSGFLSDYPDLRKLDRQDNLAVTIDFRRVYASLLEQWLGAEAHAVIPNAAAFGRVELVA